MDEETEDSKGSQLISDGISYVLGKGPRNMRCGLDCRRIQIFGANAQALNKLLPKYITKSSQISRNQIALKDMPSRIVIRNGAIDNFLEATDRSNFDVAMFYEGEDQAFINLNEERSILRQKSKKNFNKVINQQSTDALKDGITHQKNVEKSAALNIEESTYDEPEKEPYEASDSLFLDSIPTTRSYTQYKCTSSKPKAKTTESRSEEQSSTTVGRPSKTRSSRSRSSTKSATNVVCHK